MSSDPIATLAADPRVAGAADAVREAAARLAWHRALRRHGDQCRTEISQRAATASAQLVGARVALDRLRQLALGEPAVDPGERVTFGTLRTITLAASAKGEQWAAPRGMLARLHAVLATGLLPKEEIGRPAAASSSTRMDDVCSLIANNHVRDQVVRCALVEAELIDAGALGALGDVVARAASRSLALVHGVDPAGVLLPEVGQAEDPAGRQQALDGYHSGSLDGVVRWVAWWCSATSSAEAASADACARVLGG